MEWFLIKAVINRSVNTSVLSEVDGSFFTDEVDRKVWNLLRSAFERGRLVGSWSDLYVFALREGASGEVLQRIAWFQENDIDLSQDLVLDTIEKFWKEKVVVEGVRRVEEKLLKGGDIGKIVEDLGSVYRKAVGSFIRNGVREEVLDGVLERMVGYAVEERLGSKLLSGFAQLDAVLGGGYRCGTMVVWLGATSVGKTMMLVFQSVMFALQEKRVLFISLEDSKDVVLERFDKLLFFGVKNDVKKVMKEVDVLKSLGRIEVMYTPKLSIEELEGMVESLEGQVDVFVIDYGDLVGVERGYKESDWVEQGEVFQRMMRLADQYNLWVVTASQANREAVDRKVLSLSNVGRSYRKVQVADYVIALSQTKDEEQQGLIRIVVLKNKFGRRGDVIPLKVIRECGYFREESL